MKSISPLRSAVCAAALLSGQAAFADVTAAQVWEDWQANMAIYGEDGVTIGATEVGDGTVTVTDFALSVENEFDDTKVNADLGTLVFTENGDGSVTVTLPETYLINMDLDSSTTMDLAVTMTDSSVVVSGDPGALNYAISIGTYGFDIAEFTADGAPVPMTANITINDMVGNYMTGSEGDVQSIDMDITSGDVVVAVDFQDPDSADYAIVDITMDNMSAKGGGTFPDMTQLQDPENVNLDGLDIDVLYALGASNAIFDINVEGDQVAGSVSQSASDLNIKFSKDVVAYATSIEDLDVQMQVPDLPFPIELSLASHGLGFEMPLSTSDEPRPFGLNFSLIDLAISDQIWGMVDPAGTIPRDPATIDIDMTGNAKLFFDIMDPEQAEAMAFADVPGELVDVALNKLKVAVAGAEITGAGGFVFDNTDLNTFGGIPRPEGELNVDIKGANALIDTLVGMGLVPEDQAMMGRMMMGMFARSTGDDELSSKIEINAEGHVLANGQRLQ